MSPRETPPRQQPRLRSQRLFFRGLFFVVVLSGLLLGVVAFQARIAQQQHRIDALRKEKSALLDQKVELASEVAVLESPARLDVKATEYGMVQATEVVYGVLDAATQQEVQRAGGDSNG